MKYRIEAPAMNISFSEPQDTNYGDISIIMFDDVAIGEVNIDKGIWGLYNKYNTPALNEKVSRAVKESFPEISSANIVF